MSDELRFLRFFYATARFYFGDFADQIYEDIRSRYKELTGFDPPSDYLNNNGHDGDA